MEVDHLAGVLFDEETMVSKFPSWVFSLPNGRTPWLINGGYYLLTRDDPPSGCMVFSGELKDLFKQSKP